MAPPVEHDAGEFERTRDGDEGTAGELVAAHGRTEAVVRSDLDGSQPSAGRNHLRHALIAGDGIAAAVAWLLTLRATGTTPPELRAVAGITGAGVMVVWLVASAGDLYRSRVSSVRSLELAKLVRASLLGSAFGALLVAANGEDPAWTIVLVAVVAALLQFVLLATTRSVFDDWLKQRRRLGQYCRPLIFFGFDHDVARLVRILDEQPELGYRVLGYVGAPGVVAATATRTPWLGTYGEAVTLVEELGASGVVVASGAKSEPSASTALDALLRSDVHVQLSAGLQGIDARRVRALPIAHEPLLYIERTESPAWGEAAKRASDLVLAPILLVLASPILAVAAVAVKLHDGGPVLFRQERVGRHGVPFSFLKLRTMTPDAATRQHELEAENQRRGPLFKMTDDPRVTGPGRLLRLLSIDELPQLWNVLRGEMSLVGPRPALASEVEAFDEELRRRHEVKPGITGLWQVEARDNPSFAAYRRLDVFYVDNWSLSLDLGILVLTVHTVVLRAAHALGRRLLPGRESPIVGTLDG